MKPKELKELAEKSSKAKFDKIYAQLKTEAEKGYTNCKFKGLPDGAVKLLKEEGFVVKEEIFNDLPGIDNKNKEYIVSFG